MIEIRDEYISQMFKSGFSEQEVINIISEYKKMKNNYVRLDEANDLPELKMPRGRGSFVDRALGTEPKAHRRSDDDEVYMNQPRRDDELTPGFDE